LNEIEKYQLEELSLVEWNWKISFNWKT